MFSKIRKRVEEKWPSKFLGRSSETQQGFYPSDKNTLKVGLPYTSVICLRRDPHPPRSIEGELTDEDRLVYVNSVLKGKLLESETLIQQAANNTKEQFANSPDLAAELMNAIMDALAAHTTMSSQALGSERVRNGLRDILLGPGRLYEALRDRNKPTDITGPRLE